MFASVNPFRILLFPRGCGLAGFCDLFPDSLAFFDRKGNPKLSSG
jgi:hypothetical protein